MIRRNNPYRVFILQVRADKLLTSQLREIVGEIPRPIVEMIEQGLRDGNVRESLQRIYGEGMGLVGRIRRAF